MSKKILSLDLGVTSIGYSILHEIKSDRYSLLDYGVSMFDKPTDKNGNSKKLLHSASAATTKLYDLRKERKQNLALLFEEFCLSTRRVLLNQEKQNHHINKWELRAKKVFEEKLEVTELFTIFYALAKHRGYKSLDSGNLLEELCAEQDIELDIKKSQKDDDEKGKIKNALKTIENLHLDFPEKTVAQIIYETEMQKNNPTFRNHDNYNYMIRREYINDEIRKIILSQKEFGFFDDSFKIEEFISRVIATIDDQKDSTNDMSLFGFCEYYKEKEQRVAHQYSLLADIYKMYESVANINFNKEKIPISKEQIKLVADDFFAKVRKGKSIADIKYKEIRKILKLDEGIKIFDKEDSYSNKGKKQENTIIKFHFVNNLSKINHQFIVDILEQENRYELLKEIFDVLAYEKAPHTIYEKLKDKIKDEKTIVDLIQYKSGNSLHISHYAMMKFIPYFEQGFTTNVIKQKLGLDRKEDYSHFKKGIKYLHVKSFEEDDKLEINNHPVKYVVSATLRVIKHLHSVHGAFDEIRVESTRELSLPTKEQVSKAKKEGRLLSKGQKSRESIDNANKENEAKFKAIVENKEYQKLADSSGRNLRKYAKKLLMWEEQDKICPYCQTDKKNISMNDIFSNSVDVDHIVPKSLGGLYVKHNLVLVHRNCNVSKSNQLPMNYLKDKVEFKNTVDYLFENHKINWKKKKNLLATNLDETVKDIPEHTKALRATSYIEALTAQLLKRYYPFVDEKKQADGSAVRHIQGRATSNIRKLLGVKTKVRDTNIHHAIDAILIGFTNHAWLQKLSNTFRENMGVIDDEARANIKKDTPIIELIVNDEVEYLEPKELCERIEESYNEFGEDSVFYKNVWGKVKVVNFWVSKKPDSSNLHEKTIYGIDKLRGQIDNKKYTGLTTLRIDIIKRLNDSKKKPNFPKIGDDPKKYLDEYNQNIVEKLYVYQYNKNDKIVSIVQKKGQDIYSCLLKYVSLDKKDKSAFQDATQELSSIINNPLIDYNGNIIRKIKIIYSNKTDEHIIRGGTTVAERITLGISISSDSKSDLEFKKIDFKDKLAKKLDKVLEKNSLNVYRNDLVCFIYKNEDKNKLGLLESFDSKTNKVRLFSSKYPKLLDSQPSYFKVTSGKSRREFGMGSAIGIIKLNLDITGNIKSYTSICNAQSELLEFIKESING